jgi:hypothetical protein
MGRFHYWLSTGQVTKFRPVLHCPPFDIIAGLLDAIVIVHIVFSNRIIAYRRGTVKYLILSGLYYEQDFCTKVLGTFR